MKKTLFAIMALTMCIFAASCNNSAAVSDSVDSEACCTDTEIEVVDTVNDTI